MIVVDIRVPSIGRTYNFSLDEQTSLSVLIPEISEVICQKENCSLENNGNQLTLSSPDTQMLMDPKASLSSYGIKNGSTLVLI